jgi:hypothetical protein
MVWVVLLKRSVLGKLVMNAKSIVLAGIGCVLMFLAGCGGSGKKPAEQRNIFFPPEVAGIWLAYDSPWVIELSKDGKVIMAQIPMGDVEIAPNEITEANMIDGQISTYEAGDCPVEFNPLTRELTVTIVLKAFHIKYFDDRIDGNSIDIFVGRVSEDGRNWYADWYTFFDYGPRFPRNREDINDMNMVYMDNVLFEKVIRRQQAAEDANTAKGGLQDRDEMILQPRIPADSNAVRH